MGLIIHLLHKVQVFEPTLINWTINFHQCQSYCFGRIWWSHKISRVVKVVKKQSIWLVWAFNLTNFNWSRFCLSFDQFLINFWQVKWQVLVPPKKVKGQLFDKFLTTWFSGSSKVCLFRHQRGDGFGLSKICRLDSFLTSFWGPRFCVVTTCQFPPYLTKIRESLRVNSLGMLQWKSEHHARNKTRNIP